MSCKYKYNNQWYTKEDIFNLLLKERNINSKGELIKPVISNSKLSKKFEVVDDWNINDDGSSKLIKRFNTKEEANEYIKNIQEFHEAAGFKYGVIETLFANNGIEPRITNETLKESIDDIKRKNTSLQENQWAIEPYAEREYAVYTYMGEFVEGQPTFTSLEEANKWLKENQPKVKEYTSQALINTKVAKLKEVAKKYPRSLIRSEVRPIMNWQESAHYDMFDIDELPFQKLSSKKDIEGFKEFVNNEKRKIGTNENNRTRENESTSTSRENNSNGRDYYLSETFKEASENFIWSSEDGHRYNFGSLSVIQGLAERTGNLQKMVERRKERLDWDVNEDGDVAPLNAYFQKNEEISAIDAPKDFNDLFNSLESIKSVLDLLNKPIFNNLIFDEYYLTETNKDRFKSIFIKEGLDEKSVDFIINFIEENRLQREKLSVVIGKIKQNLIFKSKGLNYYNAILTQQADNKLDEFLVNFLKEKLSVNVVKNSIEHYGSAMAVADILNKVILINNKNLKTLPEETGHFFFELLGKQNKLQLDLLNNVKKWEGYSMVYEKYKTTYVTINENGETTIDEEKIKREAVGQAIGEAIVRNHKAKNGDTFFSLLQEAVDFIKNLLNKLGIFNFDGTIDEIAKDILNQDISKIKQIKDDNYQKRTFKDTLANYPELQQMIDNFINIGAKLTGSLGYRDAGDLFRPLDEDVHDLDFRIYKEAFGDDIENFLNKVLKIYPQMKIRTHANGKHMMWTTNSKNLALLINIDGLLIDLFFYNYNSNNKESTVNWYEAFKEKYQMGRPKDMNDILRWANFTPINLADSTKPFVYYQLNEDNNRANIKPRVEELFNENQVKEFISNNNNQKTEDYFSNEINKIQEESKTIDEKISKFESTQKIDNKNTSKALQNMQEKVKIIGDKLLSLGFESINEKEHDFKTSSYITFKSKLKELENIDIDINTFKSPDYLIKTKIKSFKNNFNPQKQGELPFNPIELKIALSENEFIKDIADNTFEGLTDEQIKILKENLDKGEFNLNCKI